MSHTDYIIRMSTIKAAYEQRAIQLLHRIRNVLAEEGMFSDEPTDLSADTYQWGFLAWRSEHRGDNTEAFSVTLSLEEEECEGEPTYEMSWSILLLDHDATVLCELRPYNYTQFCWVDGRDDEAVEERFETLEASNIGDIPDFVKEAA